MTRSLPVIALAAALVAGNVSAPTAARAATAGAAAAASGAKRVTAAPTLETQVLAAINGLRRDRGLAPLRANPALAVAAEEHSLSMAEHGFFAHASLGGTPFWRRLEAGYPPHPGRAWSVGENLVWASPGLSAQRVLELWLGSPPHRRNLLAPAWREIGVGAVHALGAPGVYGGLHVTILTADFGVRG